MAINKVVYGGETLLDLTADTVDAAHLLAGSTAHDKSGAVIQGACTFDSDTSGDTAAQAEILSGKTAHARGAQLTGTMPNNGKVTGTISTKSGTYPIPQGYHDGSGSVSIAAAEQAKLVPANIAEGITILGVAGSHKAGADEVKQSKTVTPGKTQQIVTPDSGYTCLAQVTVEAIPYAESQNAAGGTTVTIAG